MKITRRQLRQTIREVISHEINERKDYSGDGYSSSKSQESPVKGNKGDTGDTDDTGDTGQVATCSDLSDAEIFVKLKEHPLGDIVSRFHIDGTHQKRNGLAMFNPGGILQGIQTLTKSTSSSYSMLPLKSFLALKDHMIKKWEKSEGLSPKQSESRWNDITVGEDYLALMDVISWIKRGEVECP